MKYVMKSFHYINEEQLKRLKFIDRTRVKLLSQSAEAKLYGSEDIKTLLDDLSRQRQEIIRDKINSWVHI